MYILILENIAVMKKHFIIVFYSFWSVDMVEFILDRVIIFYASKMTMLTNP